MLAEAQYNMSTNYLNHYIIYFILFVSMNIFVFVDIHVEGIIRVLLLNYLLTNFSGGIAILL